MEWVAFTIAATALGFVVLQMEQNKKLEKRIEELENKTKLDGVKKGLN